MAPHSSVLAWRVPGAGEPGGLPSVGSHSVGHDWSDLAAAAAATSGCLAWLTVCRWKIWSGRKKTCKWPTGAWKNTQHHYSSGRWGPEPQCAVSSHPLGWRPEERQEVSVGENVETRHLLCTVGGIYAGSALMGNNAEVPQKVKNRTTVWSRNPTSGRVYTQRKWRQEFKEICALPCLLQHDSRQPRDGNSISGHQWMNG